MRDPFADKFYSSIAWKNCRKSFIKSRGGLCERCLSRGVCVPGIEVHHKIHLTPYNINNPEITLNYDNLELLCKACHAEAHHEHNSNRRYSVDENGNILISED